MSNILIAYSSVDGHTIKICSRLAEVLKRKNNQVELVAVDQVTEVKLRAADKLVVGASIRYGKHRKSVYDFVNKYEPVIASKSNVSVQPPT